MHGGILRINAPQYAGRETVGVGHAPRRTGRRDRAAVEQGPAVNAPDGGGFIARTLPGGWRQSRNGHGGTVGGARGSMVSGMTRRRVAATFRGPRPDCRYGPGFRPATAPDGLAPVTPAAPGFPAGSTRLHESSVLTRSVPPRKSSESRKSSEFRRKDGYPVGPEPPERHIDGSKGHEQCTRGSGDKVRMPGSGAERAPKARTGSSRNRSDAAKGRRYHNVRQNILRNINDIPRWAL